MKIVLFLVIAILSQIFGEMIRMESSINSFVSKNWFQEKRTDENAMVKAVFVLKHDRNIIRDMDRELINRSSPSSSSYGKWLKVSYDCCGCSFERW
jgi:hypothetical protein